MKKVILYTKPGCHLCEAAEQVIARVAKTHALHLARVNILDDPAAFQSYQYDIPVVMVNNIEIARHRLTDEQLLKALQV